MARSEQQSRSGKFQTDDGFLTWAINELPQMRSPSAKAELKRFLTELDKLSNSSERKQRLNYLRRDIESTLESFGPDLLKGSEAALH